MNDSVRLRVDQLGAVLLFALILGLVAVAYAPGIGGSYHFDDETNLGGLESVTDLESAIAFVFEGIAGPTGRPIALASFAAQAYAWPSSPSTFLYSNICLHLLNGVLVVYLAHLLLLTRFGQRSQPDLTAIFAGGLWMLLPILASSSLLIVQRMTTLSATFVLLGFIAYLLSRERIHSRPITSLVLMTCSVIAGSVAAALAKENGALLPLLILVTEATLLPRPRVNSVVWTSWKAVALAAPSAILVGYILLSARYSEATLSFRGFTVADRLLSEAYILWEYVYRAFIPVASSLGPFQDDHVIHRDWSSLTSIWAAGGWVVVGLSAVLLRRRAPLFSFAVAWYLAGHLIESTVLPLELYFEHRNYVPLIGPAFALVVAVSSVNDRFIPITRAALGAYLLLLAIVLLNFTSLWGRPPVAAEVWAMQHPDSLRATQYRALQLMNAGDSDEVRRILQGYAESHPESASVALQVLMFDCVAEPDRSHEDRLQQIGEALRVAKFEYSVFDTLHDLYRTAKRERCHSVTGRAVYELAAAASENPAFRAVPTAHHNLHVLMAEEAVASRDLDLTMHHIELALSSHYTLSTLFMAVDVLVSAGLHQEADAFINDARSREPHHPVRAVLWRRQLDALQQAVDRHRPMDASFSVSAHTL